ncbi:galactosyl transferase GMA12/MNN10 family-domain-containing protein [Dactylonectria estremocensis]|uniref:Galactosyl transferase GMA12/MNN10 family-domain-containing protein n=1 Tax=Dactylonectria estremocensis TaxID=1079267 RepID=A0A9P9DZ36_9HYPO|nr:galactosyl transferase GMA12/MNN10 family-domain-containing protein [Dactylonectria estremocensis]
MSQHHKLPTSAIPVSLKAAFSLSTLFLLYQAFLFYHEWEEPRLISHALENVAITLLHPHGGSECLPRFNTSLLVKRSVLVRASCQQTSPYSLPRVRIGTLTAHYGESHQHYHKALQTHLMHSLVHDTPLEVLCSAVIDSVWNKPAFILALLLEEMMKPPEERLEWIFWVDQDTLILDQCRPVSSFLPPEALQADAMAGRGTDGSRNEPKDETHLIIGKDWNGPNAGVFLVRVNQWAIEFFSDIVAFRHFNPNLTLPFAEQSAMDILMSEPRFQRNVQGVPQVWFNAYPGDSPAEFEDRDDEEGLEDQNARRGDFLLHFAGLADKEKSINEWADMLDRQKNPWQPERILRNSTKSIQKIWSQLGHHAK